jgi:hypothetical protein
MRRISRMAAVAIALSGLACTVNRSGDGAQVSDIAGSGASGNDEAAGAGGMAGNHPGVVGSAGVFGVGMGTGGNGGEPTVEADREGGTSVEKGGSGTSLPIDSGTVTVDAPKVEDPIDANEASSITSCSLHERGATFTPSGAISAHCYWPHAGKSTWQDAVDACNKEGGHLATVRSEAENQFVIDLIVNLGADFIWLGGTDYKDSNDASGGGPYEWITGEPFSYAPWAMNNPDGACDATCNGRKCECQHRVCVDKNGAFWDRYENRLYYSVCESEP